MDRRLFDHIHRAIPKFNDLVCEGLAVEHMKHVEKYIDRIWECAAPGFPEGLKYEGYARCTPYEEYAIAPAKRKNKKIFEMARSDIYLVKYYFSWQGEMLRPVYLYLPFVRDGGTITLRGSTFAVSPVLADKAISVGVDSIFIPLNRDKLTFKRTIHHYKVNGKRDTAYVVWSNIYHTPRGRRGQSQQRKIVDMNATPVHYLFCKYGLKETFAYFANAEIAVGYQDITPEKFPPSEWKICEPCGMKPRGLRRRYFNPPRVKLAIRNEAYNYTTQSMIAAFFYIVDHFPDRVEPEYVLDVDFWRVLLGKIAIDENVSEGKLLNGVEAHLASLDGYIDGMVIEWLREDGIYVNDIYELFMHVIETMPERLSQSGSEVASMYGKRLTVLRYALIDIIKAIFNFMFALKPGTGKETSKSEIINAMNRFLKPRLIVRMNHKHGEVASISSPGDNKIFKITSNVVLQTNTAGGKSKAGSTIEPSIFLHGSIAEVGSFCNLPKSAPTGMSRVNPNVQIMADGSIERDPDKVELIDKVQEEIQR